MTGPGKALIEAWLRRACRASIASAGRPFHSVLTVTRCPAARRNAAQRSAVWRLPPRGPGRAGGSSAIFLYTLSPGFAELAARGPPAHTRRCGRPPPGEGGWTHHARRETRTRG